MIAAPDDCELTVEQQVEQLAQTRRALDFQELLWSEKAARVAASMAFQELGYCSPLDWVKKGSPNEIW